MISIGYKEALFGTEETNRFCEFVRIDAEDVCVAVRDWSPLIAEDKHQSMIAFRIVIEVTSKCQYRVHVSLDLSTYSQNCCMLANLLNIPTQRLLPYLGP